MEKVDYSIIIPVYYNEESIRLTFDKIVREVISLQPSRSCQIVLIDDGSGDQSYSRILEIKNEHPDWVTVIRFTRNFGQVSALMAGFAHARGKCVVTISADLQDPPELIVQMLQCHFEEGYDVVICSRTDREETVFRRWTSRVFYMLMRRLSFPDMPAGGFDYMLLGERVVRMMLDNPESNPFFQGQILWSGFKRKMIPYKRLDRPYGKSRWRFGMKVKYLLDGVMGYSYVPLRVMSVTGLITAVCGFVYALVIVYNRLFGNVPFEGWAPLMVLILLLSGLQMLMLGVIGEYLWRALDQVRRRPPYIIDEVR